MADLPRIHGAGGPVRVSVPGKSELMISVIGPITPESPEARIWAVLPKRYRVACLALDGPFQVGYLDPASVWVQPVRSKDVILPIGGCVGRVRSPGDYAARRRS